jgi:hypothetical protein
VLNNSAVFSFVFIRTRSECDLRGYLIIDLSTKRSRVMETLEAVASIVGADAEDIGWTHEDIGLWESDRWSVSDFVFPSQAAAAISGVPLLASDDLTDPDGLAYGVESDE